MHMCDAPEGAIYLEDALVDRAFHFTGGVLQNHCRGAGVTFRAARASRAGFCIAPCASSSHQLKLLICARARRVWATARAGAIATARSAPP
jgi:hypothetical protein